MREALIRLLTSTSSRHRPWQISAAVAVGVLGGFLPKTCLLFYALLAIVYCLPIHLPLSIATMLLLSPIAAISHPHLGQLGLHSLNHSAWSSFWLRLDSYPLVPWLSLHNSLVNGAALFGAAMMLPAYAVARLFVAIAIPTESLSSKAVELQALQLSNVHSANATAPATTVIANSHLEPTVNFAESDTTSIEPPSTLSQLERILASYDATVDEVQVGEAFDDQAGVADADRVIRRAALMVSAVDDILTVIEAEEGTMKRSPPSGLSNPDSSPVHSNVPAPAQKNLFARTAESERNRREDTAHPHSNSTPHDALTDSIVTAQPPENRLNVSKESDQPLSPIQTQPYQDSDTSIAIVRSSSASTLRRQNDPQDGPQGVHFRGPAEIRSTESSAVEQAFSRTQVNPTGSLISQHSSHSAVAPKSVSVAGNDRQSAVRDVREGEVLRNLLNHLRELKEKV